VVQHAPQWVQMYSAVGNDTVLLAGNKSFSSGRFYRPLVKKRFIVQREKYRKQWVKNIV
jgi:hypothetical protein